jgi:hypothetical protein
MLGDILSVSPSLSRHCPVIVLDSSIAVKCGAHTDPARVRSSLGRSNSVSTP